MKIGFNVNYFLRLMNESHFLNVEDNIFFCFPRLYFYLRGQPFRHTKAKLLHMNTAVNIAPRGVVFPWQSDRYARRIFRV